MDVAASSNILVVATGWIWDATGICSVLGMVLRPFRCFGAYSAAD